MKILTLGAVAVLSLTFIGCEKKTTKTEINLPVVKKSKPAPSESKTKNILAFLTEVSAGFECELENTKTNKVSKVFYFETIDIESGKANGLKLFTVDSSDSSKVEPNLNVGNRDVFFLATYDKEEKNLEGIFKIWSPTTLSKGSTESKIEKEMLINSYITYDSKINEFDITITGQSPDGNEILPAEYVQNARIKNCVQAEKILRHRLKN